jgi:hypothetical protein
LPSSSSRTHLDCEGSILSRDGCSSALRRGNLAGRVGLDGSQVAGLGAALGDLAQDTRGPHGGGLDDLRQHIEVRVVELEVAVDDLVGRGGFQLIEAFHRWSATVSECPKLRCSGSSIPEM